MAASTPPRSTPVRSTPPALRLSASDQHKQRLGAHGETLAARHLCGQGLVLLDRNWRCDAGEIDLVLRDGATLVICEVKTRSSLAFGSPLESVDARKADRLRRLAARWLYAHDVHPDDIRIDLVGVLVPHRGEVEIDHVRGIA